MMLDTLIGGGILLTMSGNGSGVIVDGAVGIQGSKIIVSGDRAQIEKEWRAHQYISGEGKIILPGFINAAMSSAFTNEDPAERKEASLIWISNLIKSGTTTICDQSPDAALLAENYHKVGCRAILSGMISDEKSLQDNLHLIERHHNTAEGRITCAFGISSPTELPKPLIREAFTLAREQEKTVHGFLTGEDVILLHREQLLNNRLKAAGLAGAGEAEMAYLLDAGAAAVLCPTAEAALGRLPPPYRAYVEANGRLGIGTGSTCSGFKNSMFLETKTASLLYKQKHETGTAFPAWIALKTAICGGARAVGMDRQIGSIEAGKAADLILVDANVPELTPVLYDPIRNIVPNLAYSADGSEVVMVMVAGRIIAADGKLITS